MEQGYPLTTAGREICCFEFPTLSNSHLTFQGEIKRQENKKTDVADVKEDTFEKDKEKV